MAVEETKEYTPEQKAQFWEELAIAEEQFGADTFCPDLERHQQKWQRRKDRLLVQIAEAQNSSEREHLQQKLIELEQVWKRSAKTLAYLIELNKLNN
jgi:hypothetical protein